MATEIEKAVETGLRTALRAQLDASATTRDLPVSGFWLEPEERETRLAPIPGLWITCNPYLPENYTSAAEVYPCGRCTVRVQARVSPADDVDGAMMRALWAAVTAIIYKGAYSFSDGVTKGGHNITATDAGTDDYGAFAAVTVEVVVTVT